MPVCFSKAWAASSIGGLLAEPAKTIISFFIEVGGEVVLVFVVVDVTELAQPAITRMGIKDSINTKDTTKLILCELFK